MEFVDTHCHIQSADLADLPFEAEKSTHDMWAKADNLSGDVLVANAVALGVTKMICVGCTLEDSQLAVEFVKSRENCAASIGIHPHEAALYDGDNAKLDAFRELAKAEKVVAIGETGFDFYYNHSPKEDQEKILRFQLELALEHDLPLIFHVRDAFDDFWRVAKDYPGIRGVIHSFSADRKVLDGILEHGLHVGLNGIMTFTKFENQLEAARAVPIDKLLLETDAPFLTPTPYRGTINQPKNVRVVAEFLADLRGETLSDLAAATTRNARALFKL